MRLASVLLSAILLPCLSIQARADVGDIAVPRLPAPDMRVCFFGSALRRHIC